VLTLAKALIDETCERQRLYTWLFPATGIKDGQLGDQLTGSPESCGPPPHRLSPRTAAEVKGRRR
jgi:hypothetical protein